MTNETSVSEMLEDIDLLLDLGGMAEARELAAQILDTADPETLEVLAHIAWVRENNTKTVNARMRDAWKRSTLEHRELIETCVVLYVDPITPPVDEATPAEPEVLRADVHIPTTRAEAPELRTSYRRDVVEFSPVRRKVDPAARIARRTKKQIRTAIKCAKTVHRYQWSRAGVDDQPPIEDRPFNYENDYDETAVPALQGLACVHCWQERSAKDNRHHTDGLCDRCRSLDRSGLPSLPATAWRDEIIAARCKFIATTFPRSTALAILRKEADAYGPADQWDMKRLVHNNFGWNDEPKVSEARETHYAMAA